MTRSTQTILIVGTVLALALGWFIFIYIPAENRSAIATGDSSRCWNQPCRDSVVDGARERLMRGF